MKTFGEFAEGKNKGLWDNIHAKRKRIKAGSGEKMRKPGSEGAPTAQDFKDASESIEETKGAPKGFHFTRDGKLKRGDADVDGPGGAKLRSDPLDKQRSKIPPVSENFMDGKGPGKSGDAARHGLKGKSKAELKKIRSSDTASPRKKQLAHWMLNMHHNEQVEPKQFGMADVRKLLNIEEKATLNDIDKAFKDTWPGDIEAGTNKLLKRYKERTPGQ